MQAHRPGVRGKGDHSFNRGRKSAFGVLLGPTVTKVPAAGDVAARPEWSLDSNGGGLGPLRIGVICTLVCS